MKGVRMTVLINLEIQVDSLGAPMRGADLRSKLAAALECELPQRLDTGEILMEMNSGDIKVTGIDGLTFHKLSL